MGSPVSVSNFCAGGVVAGGLMRSPVCVSNVGCAAGVGGTGGVYGCAGGILDGAGGVYGGVGGV